MLYSGAGLILQTCVEVREGRVGGCQMEGSLGLTVASSSENLVCTVRASEVNPYCTSIPSRLEISSREGGRVQYTTVNYRSPLEEVDHSTLTLQQYTAVHTVLTDLASCQWCPRSPPGPPARLHPRRHYPPSDCASCALPCDDSSKTSCNITRDHL